VCACVVQDIIDPSHLTTSIQAAGLMAAVQTRLVQSLRIILCSFKSIPCKRL
jgi:hypothetical protein